MPTQEDFELVEEVVNTDYFYEAEEEQTKGNKIKHILIASGIGVFVLVLFSLIIGIVEMSSYGTNRIIKQDYIDEVAVYRACDSYIADLGKIYENVPKGYIDNPTDYLLPADWDNFFSNSWTNSKNFNDNYSKDIATYGTSKDEAKASYYLKVAEILASNIEYLMISNEDSGYVTYKELIKEDSKVRTLLVEYYKTDGIKDAYKKSLK